MKGKARKHMPTRYRIAVSKEICELYAEGSYTIASCCEVFKVQYNTFQSWAQPRLTEEDIKKKSKVRKGFIPEVHELYKKAIIENEANFREKARQAARQGLLLLAQGGWYEEVTSRYSTDETGRPQLLEVNTIKRYRAPNIKAAMFVAQSLDTDFRLSK